MAANVYSARWQARFGATRDRAGVGHEVAFLQRMLPLPAFRRVLDVPCGFGLHARALAAAGYAVEGADRDPTVVDAARAGAPAGATFRVADLRDLPFASEAWDAVVNLWASFGYFAADGNRRVLAGMRNAVRPGGRVVLEVQDRRFFERRPPPRMLQAGGERIAETTELRGGRLHVRLRYADGAEETFEWQAFTPAELDALGADVGLEPVLACAQFDERVAADATHARFQSVYTRPRCQAPSRRA